MTAKIADALTPDRVLTGMALPGKKRLFETLAQALAKATDGTTTETEVLAALLAREKLGTTALGHGVAIPHNRLATLTTPVGVFVRPGNAVEYEAHDGRPVDLVFALLIPQTGAGNAAHLELLAAIAEKFSEETFCESLRKAPDASAVYALLVG